MGAGISQSRRLARFTTQAATAVSASSFFTFALGLSTCVTVGRLHEVVPILAQLYLGKLSTLILIGALVLESKRLPIAEAFKTKTAKCLGAVTLFGFLSVPTSYWPGRSFDFLKNSWPLIAILAVGLLAGLSNRVTARRIIAALTLVAALGAAELMMGGGYTQGTMIGTTISQRSYIGGGGSTTYDANYSAAFFVMMLPYALMFASRKGPLQLIAISAVPILGIAMIKTGSRGGIVALAVLAVCILVFSDKKSRPKQAVIFAICVAAMLLTPHTDIAERLRALFTGEDYNFDAPGGRWSIWSNGITMLFQRPLLGVGVNAFSVANAQLGGRFLDPHNAYVQIAAELGFPGIVAFFIMIVAAFKSLRGMRKQSLAILASGQPSEQASLDLALSTAALCALIAELTAALFLSLAYEPMTVFALTVPIGMTLGRASGTTALAEVSRNGAARLRGIRRRAASAQRPPNRGLTP